MWVKGKYKHKGSASKVVFGQPMNVGDIWLEDRQGFRHLATPIGSAKTGKTIGYSMGKSGSVRLKNIK